MSSTPKYILTITLIIFFQLGLKSQDTRYGLMFSSYEVEKDFRTGLNLTPEHSLSLPNVYSISFDMNLKRSRHGFGYILRMITEDNHHLDFLINRPDGGGRSIYLTFVDSDGKNFYRSTMEEAGVNFDKWINIRLSFNTMKENLTICIDDKEFTTQNMPLKSFKKPFIIFGKNNHPLFQTSDIASMIISNVKIRNEKNKLLYHWALHRHMSDGVLDEIEQSLAVCENPSWIIDQYASWKKIKTFKTSLNPQITFNKDKEYIAFIDKDNLYEYNLSDDIIDTIPFQGGKPSGSIANQFIYDEKHREYITYDFESNISKFDLHNRVWDNTTSSISEPEYWHHNRFVSLKNNKLLTFLGYGFHKYSNTLNIIDLDNGHLEKRELKQSEDTIIYPRYLAGLGAYDDSHVLLFGGYGSVTGNQELAPKNFYDLYKINTETYKIEKIWQIDSILTDNFVVGNSMYVDTVNKCFYALCYPHQQFNSQIKLYRFSLTKPKFEILADSIPYYFSDIKSFADLYYSKKSNELIAVTSSVYPGEKEATISVYSLRYPPLAKDSLIQKQVKANTTLYIIIIISILVLLTATCIYIRKKRYKRIEEVKEPIKEIEPIIGIKPILRNANNKAILLLGGFQVLDKESKDITGEFTPILKQLFLLILLNTLKDSKGISSVKLNEILWFDKTEESARNNRNVSLNKLRNVFKRVGEITIDNENSYWTIKFEDIYCDFYEAIILIQELKLKKDITNLKRLIAILQTGELLPNLQIEWVDAFKSDFSNLVTEFLLEVYNSKYYNLDENTQINIADIIFIQDSLDEHALKIKCKALVKLGRYGLAQNIYNSYTKEYQALFNVTFNTSFEDIIS